MNGSRRTTPNKINRATTSALYQSLKNDSKRKLRNSIYWSGLNTCILGILIYDILHTSPIHFKSILYIEYLFTLICFLNLLYHIACYIIVSREIAIPKPSPQVFTASRQPDPEPSSFLCYSPKSFQYEKTPTKSLQNTPINTSAMSWLSNESFHNKSGVKSAGSSFTGPGSPNTSVLNNYYETSALEFITDEQSLVDYLRGYENYEKSITTNNQTEQPVNLMSTFWTHPSSKITDVTHLLKNCSYQLSPPVSSSSSPNLLDRTNTITNQLGTDTWDDHKVKSMMLVEWNANIRMWLSQTILERLTKQFDEIDADLQKHGFSDIKIGTVGLDHLRKTSQMAVVLQYIPTLSILIPFLEITSNQEYLVERIRELANGGCMSNFKWNSGGNVNDKKWNDSMPTDSEIIMHLFITYMDIQLPPIPNHPDIKPFSGCYYIKYKQDVPPSTKIAIQQYTVKPPRYRVLYQNDTFEMVQGYNNLFHTLLFFLFKLNQNEFGMLGGVNLGKSGINILWVIGE